MVSRKAVTQYLDRYAEPDLPAPPTDITPWQQVLVIPVFDESPDLIRQLLEHPGGTARTLIILVLNRPADRGDSSSNTPLRSAIAQLPAEHAVLPSLHRLGRDNSLYLFDQELRKGITPAAQGVGLARKLGCDLALLWAEAGLIRSDWISSSDADAVLPEDYFAQQEHAQPGDAALAYPFWHSPTGNRAISLATAVYELRLHHHVLGLKYAGSPYAYHTLGSCIAVRRANYAAVRGFPKRAGGEDFYLLNKLTKTGGIRFLAGQCLQLASRDSTRVPFGTGPAVGRLVESGAPLQSPIFYHPQIYLALKVLLLAVAELYSSDNRTLAEQLPECSDHTHLVQGLAAVATAMGMTEALAHCRRHSSSWEQFLRHFHQWFDGFRTLKFIHTMRERGWSNQSLSSLRELSPELWPGAEGPDLNLEELRVAIAAHWQWQSAAATPGNSS